MTRHGSAVTTRIVAAAATSNQRFTWRWSTHSAWPLMVSIGVVPMRYRRARWPMSSKKRGSTSTGTPNGSHLRRTRRTAASSAVPRATTTRSTSPRDSRAGSRDTRPTSGGSLPKLLPGPSWSTPTTWKRRSGCRDARSMIRRAVLPEPITTTRSRWAGRRRRSSARTATSPHARTHTIAMLPAAETFSPSARSTSVTSPGGEDRREAEVAQLGHAVRRHRVARAVAAEDADEQHGHHRRGRAARISLSDCSATVAVAASAASSSSADGRQCRTRRRATAPTRACRRALRRR